MKLLWLEQAIDNRKRIRPALVARIRAATGDADTFREAAELGRRVIWLHTFGERMADPKKGRSAQPPRMPAERTPRIPSAGAIPQDLSAMPDTIDYYAEK